MQKGIVLAITGFAFFVGCGYQGNETSKAPATPKWKAPYQIEFDTQATKPNPAGVALPAIMYTANSKALEKRAALVVRFDASGVKNDQPGKDQVILDPIDITGMGGTLPPNYMDSADKELAKSLGAYCMNGSVKVSVALVRSSIMPQAGMGEIDAKRLSDWLPTEVVFKNPHRKC